MAGAPPSSVFAAAVVAVAAGLWLSVAASPISAGERTVVGAVEDVDARAGTLSVRDGKGVLWHYVVAKDSGIDLSPIRRGDRVAVTIARPTPLNMISAADTLRKGDKVVKATEGSPGFRGE